MIAHRTAWMLCSNRNRKSLRIFLTRHAGDAVDGNWMGFEALASIGRLVTVGMVDHATAAVPTGVANMKTTIGICNIKALFYKVQRLFMVSEGW